MLEGCLDQMALLIVRYNPIYWVMAVSAVDVKEKGSGVIRERC